MPLHASPTLHQQPVLAPSQRLALEVLRMPLAELQLFLRQELEENSLLEPSNESTGEPREAGAAEWAWDERPANPPSLHEHLLLQIRCVRIGGEVREAAERLIEWLEPDGYLRSDLAEIAEAEGLELARLTQALALVQRLDPVGLGAGTLAECLLIQLEERQLGASLAARIVRDHLDLLAGHRLDVLAHRLAASPEELRQAITLIKQLDPKPARNFGAAAVIPLAADVLMQWRDGSYEVELNESGVPRLRLNAAYQQLLRDAGASADARQFLDEQLRQAQWVLSALRQRKAMFLSITRCAVELQREYFLGRIPDPRPLTRQEVARHVGCHASTVSRAIAGKYLRTPSGIMPLSGLFGRARSRV